MKPLRRVLQAVLAAGLLAAAFIPARAATITGVSPQGEVAQVGQLVVRFDRPVVPLGDLRQGAPVSVDCQGAPATGPGRWNSPNEWVLDFPSGLPPGTRCLVTRRADWQPLAGELTGPQQFRFNTGGPAVRRTHPYDGETIEEDQLFAVELTGAVDEAALPAHAWCEVEGLAEALPVTVIGGAVRDAIVRARRLERQPAEQLLVLGCGRPLPAEARVRLVWGKGIAARDAGGHRGVRTRTEQRFGFQVRKPFTAEFSCQRERASAPCMPIRPLVVRFSAAVPRPLAAQVRLQPATGGAAIAPRFDADERAGEVGEVAFAPPLAENARYTVVLPSALRDLSGRPLANAASFPLAVATGEPPPIAKFAAAPFGVVEWTGASMLPVTLRHVQGDLRPRSSGGQVRIRSLRSDAEVIAWHRKLHRHHETRLPARELGLPESEWTEQVEQTDERGRSVRRRVERLVATREVSLLNGDAGTRRLDLPALDGGDPRPFEVVGIPLTEPGYQVVEIESRRLGASLLARPAPMFVRTGVLVTNLGVHYKQGRENALVWVTSLDRGRPVAGAEVALSDCHGSGLWSGRTDADGLARVPLAIRSDESCPHTEAVFVSARKTDAAGRVDMAFVYNGWVKGIEPWRFGVAFSDQPGSDLRAHTVFDRTLLRAGEMLSMKHFVRREHAGGLALPPDAELPARLKIVHDGSGEEFVQPLVWQRGRSLSSWSIPRSARLGRYRVELDSPEAAGQPRQTLASGEFRVEAFRVPLLDVRLTPPRDVAAAASEVVLAAQLNWMSGGGVARAALQGSALLRARDVRFAGYDDFGFQPPRPVGADARVDDGEGRLVVDKQALVTDAQGAARFAIASLPPIDRASELLAELAFDDPNGERQTVSASVPLWPAAVVPGIRAAGWIGRGGRLRFTALALDTAGRPLADQPIEVVARWSQVVSTRKRMVGGFYAYDNRTETGELGTLCSGRTDRRGLLLCEAAIERAGQVELVARARDAAGRVAQAATQVWVSRHGELWFEQDNDDRIDVLAERKRYEPGERARLQVRMPFRDATALVAIEREGVIDTRVIRLRGDDPSFEVEIGRNWAPNVYVSVLALRGRIRDVPWTSLFSWGWKQPLEWARAFWYERGEYRPPSAMVDLARPAFKLGVAALRVGLAEHELQVAVTPDRRRYAVRDKALVRVRVSHGGQPAAGADVAFAAVDEGLLALRDNDSWQLLQGLLRERAWGVQTATAQGEIIGRRHYGRKAVPSGGGGGRGATRELFDTLLLWRGAVALDERGEALVEVPLNDSLTAFRLVAVAAAGDRQFGTGSARIEVTQDLQLLSGLPPRVREGDRFSALLTLRNTTAREMKVRATLQGRADGVASTLALPPLERVVAPGGAQELIWPVEVPVGATALAWQAAATEIGGAAASDRLDVRQPVGPAVPLRVLQATLQPLEGSASWPIAAPAGALPAAGAASAPRGGLIVAVQPRLGRSLPGIRRFFETYPFTCLEQQVAKAVGLGDAALWAEVANALPTHLDADGLAAYFPPQPGDPDRGSDRLTAHVLAAAHEAGLTLPPAVLERMLAGLTAFVEGRIERRFWSPRADRDVRKLAAIDALARYGRAHARMLGSIEPVPQRWPTAALIDWLRILRRVDGIAGRDRRFEQAQQILRARLTYAGTTLRFTTEADDQWGWLMDSGDANAARLILAVIDDPAWRDELPRLLLGTLGRQQRGAWLTTTANLWGVLALERFAARIEAVAPSGRTRVAAGGAPQAVDWATAPDGGRLELPWPAAPATLTVSHDGGGRPWLSVQSLAAIELESPLVAGYAISRSLLPVAQKVPGRWSRGDVARVRLTIDAQADGSWVVLSDPLPSGASVLGSGLGRDAQIDTRGERRHPGAWPAFEERGADAFRSYFEHLPRGRHVVEYTLRLNNPGRFVLPPSRVEAMYAPESFGESPNPGIEVAP